ncbi:hypothetical protein I6N98_16030 [Spongiibacter nanhainus]|uniref:Peptidase M15A C-terminal domain-containing protein n=1 Tax=Spongiibacter nanhainus TaxID=2794344 RepID=A0A7T4QZT0_9GAMM|nr:D-Ala-D-Ala carboxypeptidase family metallohydrolase [Spongiibacter nanhainus]QQD17830.1 hypothetical protein I6N98_16030 [Spongiibacter nanhainus]
MKRLNRWLLLILSGALFSPLALIANERAFDSGLAGFEVNLNKLSNPYRVFGYFLLPNATLTLDSSTNFTATYDGEGKLNQISPRRWQWLAPSNSGVHKLHLISANEQAMQINVFVLEPINKIKKGWLNGYQIGNYPVKAFRGLPEYLPPPGLFAVNPENADIAVSPHFVLGQFICKQATQSRDKYLILRPEMLLKLETILQATNRSGIRTDTFHIMSGYRTPYYNRAIGNTPYSRHIYGGAADFFIDVSPKDGRMDDLNRDGRFDQADAAWLYEFIDGLSQNNGWHFIGGLGEYGANAAHGPFVHIDVRGYRARWGH